MSKHETLVEVLKRTAFGDWVKLRNETNGKMMTVFIPKGK